ncbi:MFS transporter [Micromonospora sp. NBC_01796]|uniref:MFS transporter n=1 Tax=Micromonospora sp. NBC_01796 TaxID=2975987 RepID=UPI002DD8E5B2|nr:MFS transporter [Micromonospora sp. NBC_01796]WSA83049.1 MFS transporter [Micromonospora sp. NBC_01796]
MPISAEQGPVAGDTDTSGQVDAPAPASVREVLALRAFRRLLIVTGLCSSGDWLALSGLAALASTLATSAAGVNFAFSGVLFANLLPGLLFAPIAGLVADRFDRRTVMAVADLARCALLLSIAVVNTYWWILVGGFLVQVATTMWIPSKDASLPRLLRRPEQLAPAAQLGLVMTYGVTILVGGGLFTLITGAGTVFGLPSDVIGMNGLTRLAIVVAALFYLASATSIATLLPELSGSVPSTDHGRHNGDPLRIVTGTDPAPAPGPGLGAMLRDSVGYLRGTPVVRGLLVGMMGALAAAGAVVGSAQPYALSLLGGQAAFGLLLLAAFLGLVVGILGAPGLARRLSHERLFGLAIVAAGGALVLVALSPHLAVALPAVVLTGACAGAAFLTGVTIIGIRVEDSMRGRVNALYQSMLKVVLGCSVVLTPLLVTVIGQRHVSIGSAAFLVDGTRPVILGGGVLAAVAGLIAQRQLRPDGEQG